jgi:predicted NUDIX family NTP pyrophosphohydrolase
MARSAGILLYRRAPAIEVLIAHMGGPFWARKDAGAWSIPKGLIEGDERAIDAARREFTEELGVPSPDAEYLDLGEFRQSSGKVVTVFAAEGDLDVATIAPGLFDLEWPPRSGKIRQFPEVDAAGWFGVEVAREKLVAGQRTVLDALLSCPGFLAQ